MRPVFLGEINMIGSDGTVYPIMQWQTFRLVKDPDGSEKWVTNKTLQLVTMDGREVACRDHQQGIFWIVDSDITLTGSISRFG